MRHTKITVEQKEEIRTLYASGAFTQVQLAEKFGFRQGTISTIVKRSSQMPSVNPGQ
jgi:DNA-binding MarR family transcriptional regulator